jgi:hypothetical protein
MERYQELIDSCINPGIILFEGAARNAKSVEDLQMIYDNTPIPALNMLNTKYVIFDPGSPPLINPNALGNAWFAGQAVIVENSNKEISAVKNFDPSKEAIINKAFRDQFTRLSFPVLENEKIELVSYQPDELVYKSSAKEEKLAVFSEIYYPAGWKSFIDGKESKYFRTNYVLRGMILPPGDHEIRFVFKPSSYFTGNTISLISSVLLILMVAAYFSAKPKMRTKD